MRIENAAINYNCPECDYRFPVTLHMLIHGLVSCPKCQPENTTINLNELLSELNDLSHALMKLRRNINENPA